MSEPAIEPSLLIPPPERERRSPLGRPGVLFAALLAVIGAILFLRARAAREPAAPTTDPSVVPIRIIEVPR